jgi:hypothetical protein
VPDKKKTSDKEDLPLEKVQDAVILDDQASDDRSETSPDVSPDMPDDTVLTDESKIDAELSEASDDVSGPDQEGQTSKDEPIEGEPLVNAEPEATQDEQPQAQPEADVAPAATAEQQPQQVIVRKGGFVPMVFGGAVAAVIGFGLAHSGLLEGVAIPGSGGSQEQIADLTQQITAQDSTLTELTQRLSTLEDAPAPEAADVVDPTPMIDDLATQIAALGQRINVLEDRPVGEASGTSDETTAAIASARRELDDIRQTLEAQRAEIAALTEDAAREEEAAQMTARAAMQRAALTRIQTALDSGAGYVEALADLRDTDLAVPQPLVDQAESGVMTLNALQTSFPDAARNALRAARQETGGSGVGEFLQSQLGLRSLEPRDGDDPDAVLSRAEAALREGRLADTLTELQILSDAAQAELAQWTAQAETRLATVAAAQDLAQTLNAN